jgi:biopolymer transport protein ExbD
VYINLSIIIDVQGKVQFYNKQVSIKQYIEEISLLPEKFRTQGFSLELYFDENLTFQEYISIKSQLSKLNSEKFRIDTHEIIYN